MVTVPRLTTIAMAEETEEKSCIVPAAAAAAAVLHGDVGGGRATYNPGRNGEKLGHATGRPDDVSMGATKPPALEEAAEKEEEKTCWEICGLRCRSNAGWQVLRLSCSWCSISRDSLSSLSSGAQYLTAISLTNCFAISLVSTFWYVLVMFVSSKFPPTDIERERGDKRT